MDIKKAARKTADAFGKNPIQALENMPGVVMLSFAEMSNNVGMDRENVINMFGDKDAVTSVCRINGELKYIIAYNKTLPVESLQKALARELGHIILKHDGSKPDDIRAAEADSFAEHFLK